MDGAGGRVKFRGWLRHDELTTFACALLLHCNWGTQTQLHLRECCCCCCCCVSPAACAVGSGCLNAATAYAGPRWSRALCASERGALAVRDMVEAEEGMN
jgi:hypothetical protein